MMFSITGNIHKRQGITITWDNGKITGDENAVRHLRLLAEEHEGQLVGPAGTGIYTETEHLKDPLSALMLMDELFDAITKREGDLPEAPALPDGAIG